MRLEASAPSRWKTCSSLSCYTWSQAYERRLQSTPTTPPILRDHHLNVPSSFQASAVYRFRLLRQRCVWKGSLLEDAALRYQPIRHAIRVTPEVTFPVRGFGARPNRNGIFLTGPKTAAHGQYQTFSAPLRLLRNAGREFHGRSEQFDMTSVEKFRRHRDNTSSVAEAELVNSC